MAFADILSKIQFYTILCEYSEELDDQFLHTLIKNFKINEYMELRELKDLLDHTTHRVRLCILNEYSNIVIQEGSDNGELFIELIKLLNHVSTMEQSKELAMALLTPELNNLLVEWKPYKYLIEIPAAIQTTKQLTHYDLLVRFESLTEKILTAIEPLAAQTSNT